jgi:cation diffusion facilitator family transporter
MSAKPASSKSARLTAMLVSVFAGVAILGIKFYAAHVSGSAALKSDAIETVANVLAALFALGAILFAERPADREHPYGHGKIEHFSAAFEGGLVVLAAAFILWEATKNMYGQLFLGVFTIEDLGLGLVWAAIGGVSSGVLGLYLIVMGKRHRSKALEADGFHVVSDFVTTSGFIVALLLVKLTGLQWLDPLVAFVIGLLLARTGFKLVTQSSQSLLDIEDPDLLERIVGVINRIRPKDIISVHELKTLRSGRHTHIDIHLVLPAHFSLKKGHDMAETFGYLVMDELGLEGEAHTHIDPCRPTLCHVCAVEPCQSRTAPCSPLQDFTLEGSTARDFTVRVDVQGTKEP